MANSVQEPAASRSRPLGVVGRTVLGLYIALLSVLLGYLVFEVWPTARPDASGEIQETTIALFGNVVECSLACAKFTS